MVFKAVHSLIRFIRPGESPQIEGMTFSRLRSRQDYLKFREQQGREIDQQMAELEAAAPAGRVPFTIPGFSFTAGRDVDFLVDYKHAGNGPINWRESVNCPVTYFNNRMRASFHIFDLEIPLRRKADLYLTEEVTPIFAYFKNKFPNAVGSEYMGTAIPLGAKNENGVRNEDLTALTFADSSFDALVSLDVLEHVPDTMKALSECRRVLRKGGRAMISAPFVAANAQNSAPRRDRERRDQAFIASRISRRSHVVGRNSLLSSFRMGAVEPNALGRLQRRLRGLLLLSQIRLCRRRAIHLYRGCLSTRTGCLSLWRQLIALVGVW